MRFHAMMCSRHKLISAPGLFATLLVLWIGRASTAPGRIPVSPQAGPAAPLELDFTADTFPSGHSRNRIDGAEAALEDEGDADSLTLARTRAVRWLFAAFRSLTGTGRRHLRAVLPGFSYRSRIYLITERFRL
ncbi:MAG: hypothetical protein WB783_04495 [Arenicellales bacterium]